MNRAWGSVLILLNILSLYLFQVKKNHTTGYPYAKLNLRLIDQLAIRPSSLLFIKVYITGFHFLSAHFFTLSNLTTCWNILNYKRSIYHMQTQYPPIKRDLDGFRWLTRITSQWSICLNWVIGRQDSRGSIKVPIIWRWYGIIRSSMSLSAYL